MLTKKINFSKQQLEQWIAGLSASGKTVIGPVKHNGFNKFEKITKFDQIILNERSSFSAKDIILPKGEVLFKFKKEKDGIIVTHGDESKYSGLVIFGARSCDAESFDYLKKFFQADQTIVNRIEAVTLVTFACRQKFPGCFCDEVGLDKNYSDKTDILIQETESGYQVFCNEKGLKILNAAPESIQDIPAGTQAARNPGKVDNLRKLETTYNSDQWKMISLGCLSCGACAFVCPTCTCYDIQDEGSTEEGHRLKCQDSCGFGLFTKHASGHNPKHTQVERRRHRIMHKFVYTQQTMGTISCVGCGRCIAACPSHMNLYNDALQFLK